MIRPGLCFLSQVFRILYKQYRRLPSPGSEKYLSSVTPPPPVPSALTTSQQDILRYNLSAGLKRSNPS